MVYLMHHKNIFVYTRCFGYKLKLSNFNLYAFPKGSNKSLMQIILWVYQILKQLLFK